MHSVQDRVSLATKAQLASQLSTTALLADKTVDSLEQLSELHLGLARVTFEQSNLVARQLAAAENARQFFVLAAAQAKPTTDRLFDYGYYLANIASSVQEEFIRAVGARIADTNRTLIELIADLDKEAPVGFEYTATLIRSVVANAAAEETARRIGPARNINGNRENGSATARRAIRRQHG